MFVMSVLASASSRPRPRGGDSSRFRQMYQCVLNWSEKPSVIHARLTEVGGVGVELVDLSRGGSASYGGSFATMPALAALGALDVVLVDYAINDAMGGNDRADRAEAVLAALRCVPSRPVVAYVESLNVVASHADAAARHGVALVRAPALLAPDRLRDARAAFGAHPPWPWHQWFADLMTPHARARELRVAVREAGASYAHHRAV